MTTIAYKDGVIAYDSRETSSGTILSDEAEKRTEHEGVSFFLSGNCGEDIEYMKVWADRACTEKFQCGGFAVDAEGVLWGCGGDPTPWRHHIDPKQVSARGSGSDHALTAMDMGATAEEAVQWAIKRDNCTGGIIRTFKVEAK